MDGGKAGQLPGWVPEGARRYLAHTEAGHAIRDLARRAGCHASTVLRQIRRIETRRDDPLVDAALAALAATHFPPAAAGSRATDKEDAAMTDTTAAETAPDSATLEREALRILRRLSESGAVLAVAEGMDKAVVVRDGGAGAGTRTAVVDAGIAQAMALQDWIACDNPGRVSRYRITGPGRSALGRFLARAENRARADKDTGFAEAPAGFAARTEADEAEDRPPRRLRYAASESPLMLLARRRDRDGQPFLADDLVRAGERLREDFELAQMGDRVTRDWDRMLTGGAGGGPGGGGGGGGPAAARQRVARALAELGPGLSDVALRCCCYLEGLELAERRMGWSARSGKIVLRIALQRLRRHYDGGSPADQLIG